MIAPMEAKLVDALPDDAGWQYEPKWDGFRAIVRRDGDRVEIGSKSGKPLQRYFPEIVDLVRAIAADRFTLDGELVLPIDAVLSFDALQQRLHPAQSRIDRLSRETPAQLMLFDALAIGDAELAAHPLAERRAALVDFHAAHGGPALLLSPASTDAAQAARWLAEAGAALDGVVAKRLDEPYRAGERAMLKVKQLRTADCVVGGIRRGAAGEIVSLLLGLYDDEGRLDHVGFTASIPAAERAAIAERVAPQLGGSGFTGKAPGGPSRWNRGEERAWEPLAPTLVVEVVYDQVTAGRFRHGTRLLRWRTDKDPARCDRSQLIHELRPAELAAVLTD